MTEFQELIRDAPKFASMDFGELLVCAYAMYAENAKLRDDVERMFKANVKKNGEITRLLDENAKLRGIACDLHKALFTLDIDHCQACPRDNINGPCTKFAPWGNDECSIEEDMRELGIEVES